jgi:hypothetical protein
MEDDRIFVTRSPNLLFVTPTTTYCSWLYSVIDDIPMASHMVCLTPEEVIFTYANSSTDLDSFLYGEEIYFANTYWNSCLATDVLVAIFSTQSMSIEFLMDDCCLVVQYVISVH